MLNQIFNVKLAIKVIISHPYSVDFYVSIRNNNYVNVNHYQDAST